MRIHTLSVGYGREAHPGDAKKSFSKEYPGAMIQTADARTAENGFFLRMIAAQTLRADETGALLARKPEIDFLLRLAGTSQISEAVAKAGSKDGEPFLVVVASLGPLKVREHVPGGRMLPSSPLSESELRRVEVAALLSARRA